eukprot:515013-Hanusia_phi.AAC.1
MLQINPFRSIFVEAIGSSPKDPTVACFSENQQRSGCSDVQRLLTYPSTPSSSVELPCNAALHRIPSWRRGR